MQKGVDRMLVSPTQKALLLADVRGVAIRNDRIVLTSSLLIRVIAADPGLGD
jgi:hypothetical protein